MDHTVISPQQVNTLLTGDAPATYIDVRTVAEFSTGHPKGDSAKGNVVNVPLVFFHPTSKEVFPNESFLQVMEEYHAKDAQLITGCDDGQRAKQAAQKLTQAGYTNIAVMASGFAGWQHDKLPTTSENRDGMSYVSLLTRVKRKGKKKGAH